MTNQNNFIKLNNVRILYPSLFQPMTWKSQDGVESAPKFECTFVLDKDLNAAEIKQINKNTDELLVPLKMTRERLLSRGYKHLALRDPAVLDKQLDIYENALIIKATSGDQRKPVLYEPDAKTIVSSQNRFYGGCHVHAYISLRVTTKHDIYVGANLHAVQFVSDGDPVGGVVFNPEGMFSPVSSTNSESNLDDNVPF